MIFGCYFLGSFEPGDFQDPVTCRTEKNHLDDGYRKGRERQSCFFEWQWWPLLAYSEPRNPALDSWAPSAWWCALWPQISSTQHLGHLTEAERPGLSVLCWTPSWGTHARSLMDTHPDGHTPWAEPLAARSHLLSVDRAFSQIFTTTFWAVNIHIRK